MDRTKHQQYRHTKNRRRKSMIKCRIVDFTSVCFGKSSYAYSAHSAHRDSDWQQKKNVCNSQANNGGICRSKIFVVLRMWPFANTFLFLLLFLSTTAAAMAASQMRSTEWANNGTERVCAQLFAYRITYVVRTHIFMHTFHLRTAYTYGDGWFLFLLWLSTNVWDTISALV